MEYINILSFIALGIASFLFFLLKKDSLKDVVSYLLAIAVSLLISSKIVSEEGNQQVSYAIILFLSLNFVLSRLKMLQEIKFSWIIPILLSVGSFAFISTNYSFNGYDFTVNSIPLLALPIVGTLIIPLARLKSKLLSSWIDLTNTEEIHGNDADRDYEFAGSQGRHYYSYEVDAAKKTLSLKNRNGNYAGETLNLDFTQLNDSTIVLNGINERKDSVYAVLNKINKKYLTFEAQKTGRRRGLKL